MVLFIAPLVMAAVWLAPGQSGQAPAATLMDLLLDAFTEAGQESGDPAGSEAGHRQWRPATPLRRTRCAARSPSGPGCTA